MHRLTRADYILFIETQTIGQQGTYDQLSNDPGAVADLLMLVEAAPSNEEKNSAIHSHADDATSSFVASLAKSTDEIEAEMAAAQSKKRPFRVYATAGGFLSFCFVLATGLTFATLPGLIPVYIQVRFAFRDRD